MYQVCDNVLTISVNDWRNAGLTDNQLKKDSCNGLLSIYRRGIQGNTLINVRSIKRPDRLQAIESTLGRINEKTEKKSIFKFEIDTEARSFFLLQRKPDGSTLDPKKIEEYVNRASIFNGIKKGLEIHTNARASKGRCPKKGDFWAAATEWYQEQSEKYSCTPIGNSRSLERIFKYYLSAGYKSIIHKGTGNDSARIVSNSIEKLFLALWRTNDKPFVSRVHELYLEFISGSKELFDKSTGEIFNPEDFRHKGRAMEVSPATVWNYLKDVVNETSVFADRNGNFDYTVKKRPHQHRKPGRYTLSKISMDDVAMSRKSVRGWVYKYIAVDVVSGYWFRPAYIVGKPNHNTVIESFRNMFCELNELGLPMPGELEVEYHLMKDFDWLGELFPFVRFCESPVEKRAEHAIKSLKYGVSKKEGHTRGRWYSRHEAYRSVRNKMSGDFVEPEFQPQTIIADDLSDIEKYNNSLHPLQKTYPGMTRKQVLLANINPNLKKIDNWHLLRYIGNETETSVRNNDYCCVANEKFELTDFNSLKRLKPNNTEVMAYWLPNEAGSVEKVYLYQDNNYIGEALNRSKFDYNECAIERTEDDEAAMLHQNKRNSQFDKFIKDHKAGIAKIGHQNSDISETILAIPVEIAETIQPKGMDEYEYEITDYSLLAKQSL
ncbi:MAG: hypothetical protein LBJ72_12465 [Dysgonamonadaceae bacterium]|jgi:outer membrane protein assembly factor BamD (BamD/ComL family)|nr:hypothetical protein [Dysgonamonadaceae bacterium]